MRMWNGGVEVEVEEEEAHQTNFACVMHFSVGGGGGPAFSLLHLCALFFVFCCCCQLTLKWNEMFQLQKEENRAAHAEQRIKTKRAFVVAAAGMNQ